MATSSTRGDLAAYPTPADVPGGTSAASIQQIAARSGSDSGSPGGTPPRGNGIGSASPAAMPVSPYSQPAVHLHSRHLEGGAMPQQRRPMYTDSAAESVASEVSELLSYPDEAASAERGRSNFGEAGGSAAGSGDGAAGDAAGASAMPATLSAGSQTLVDRLDSAHYEPRPPGLLERQDSAHEDDAETGGAEEPGVLPAPSIGDRERQDSANSLDAAVRLASQATRGRPAFAVVLEAAQARDDLAGRTSSLPQPDSAAALSRPSLQTDSAGEEDEPPAGPPPQAAPANQAPPQQEAQPQRQQQERRDSAGEMLSAATAAAATYRRPSAAESLNAARQLIMGDMAQPFARTGSSAELCDSPRQHAAQAHHTAPTLQQPPAPSASRAPSLDRGPALATASAADRLPSAAAPAITPALAVPGQRRSAERAAVDRAAAAAAERLAPPESAAAAAAAPPARPGMVRRLSLRALRRRSTPAPAPAPQPPRPQPPVQEEIQPVERSDSALDAVAASRAARPASLDTLAAARAAVLPDLAANPPPASPVAAASLEGGGEADGGLGRALSAPSSQIWSEAIAAGLRRDSPMDSLTEARRVVLSDLADHPAYSVPLVFLNGDDYAAGSAETGFSYSPSSYGPSGAGFSRNAAGGFSTLSAPASGVYAYDGSGGSGFGGGGSSALFGGEASASGSRGGSGSGDGAGPSSAFRLRSTHGRGDSAHGQDAVPFLGPAASPIEMQGGSFATPPPLQWQPFTGDSASRRPLRTGDSVGSLTAGPSGDGGRTATRRASSPPSN